MTQTAAADPQPATAANSNASNASPTDQNQTIREAAALGWALTELLSRCFLLKSHRPDEMMELDQAWTGEGMLILPPIRSDRQQIYSVLYYIRSLARSLVNQQQQKLDQPIDETAIPGLAKYLNPGKTIDDALIAQFKSKSYLDVIEEHIKNLCQKNVDPTKSTEIRGQINGLLRYWDTVLYEELQAMSTQADKAYSYLNAFLVGRSIASLRWDLGQVELPLYGSLTSVQAQILDKGSLQRLCQHIQLMAPSLPNFAALALANSVEQWGNALLQPEGPSQAPVVDTPQPTAPQPKPSLTKVQQAKLGEQAVIWHDLLTGSRDPITYVEPSQVGWRYTLKVFRFLLPYIGLGIALAAGIVVIFLFLLGYLWPLIVKAVTNDKALVSIITTIGTGFALLAGLGAAVPTVGVFWKWITGKVQSNVDQSADTAISNVHASLISMLWDAAQQEEVNHGTYIPVP